MRLEIHSVPTGHLTEIPEKELPAQDAFVITAVHRVSKRVAVFFKQLTHESKTCAPRAFDTQLEALGFAQEIAGKFHESYCSFRVQKLEVS